MLHDIIIRMQGIYTNSEVWRLALDTFRNALSRMSIGKSGGYGELSLPKGITHMNYQPRGI